MVRKVQTARLIPALFELLKLDQYDRNPQLEDDSVHLVVDAGQAGMLDPHRWAQNQLIASPGNVTWYWKEGGPSLQGGNPEVLPDQWFVCHDFVASITNTGATAQSVRVRVEEEDPLKPGTYTRYFDQTLTTAAAIGARAEVCVNGVRWLFRPRYHPRVRTTGGVATVEANLHVQGLWAPSGVELPR